MIEMISITVLAVGCVILFLFSLYMYGQYIIKSDSEKIIKKDYKKLEDQYEESLKKETHTFKKYIDAVGDAAAKSESLMSCLDLVISHRNLIIEMASLTKGSIVKELKKVYQMQHDGYDDMYMSIIQNHDKIMNDIYDEKTLKDFNAYKKTLIDQRSNFQYNLDRMRNIEDLLDDTLNAFASNPELSKEGLSLEDKFAILLEDMSRMHEMVIDRAKKNGNDKIK